jgi:response regulator of citrate/malate metabolism
VGTAALVDQRTPRSAEPFKATRLVLLTSAREIRGAEDFAALGFAAYLLKPVKRRRARARLMR